MELLSRRLLVFLVILLLLHFLVFLLLDLLVVSVDQHGWEPTINYRFILVEVHVNDLFNTLLLTILLLTEVLSSKFKHEGDFPFFVWQPLTYLIVIDEEVGFESIGGFQLHFHPVPGPLLDAICEDLSLEVISLTLHAHLLTLEQPFLENSVASVSVNGKFVARKSIHLLIFLIFLQQPPQFILEVVNFY